MKYLILPILFLSFFAKADDSAPTVPPPSGYCGELPSQQFEVTLTHRWVDGAGVEHAEYCKRKRASLPVSDCSFNTPVSSGTTVDNVASCKITFANKTISMGVQTRLTLHAYGEKGQRYSFLVTGDDKVRDHFIYDAREVVISAPNTSSSFTFSTRPKFIGKGDVLYHWIDFDFYHVPMSH